MEQAAEPITLSPAADYSDIVKVERSGGIAWIGRHRPTPPAHRGLLQ